jgi:hypothetical protein
VTESPHMELEKAIADYRELNGPSEEEEEEEEDDSDVW